MAKTDKMRLKELDLGRPLEEFIREGVAAGHTWQRICRDLDVSAPTLKDWMERLGMQGKVRRELLPLPREAAK